MPTSPGNPTAAPHDELGAAAAAGSVPGHRGCRRRRGDRQRRLRRRLDPSSISGSVDTSKLADKGPAPAVVAKGWINSPPLTTATLTGKVVLYDFWTYSCINCLRTFPYVRAWADRYQADGLVVIGVHSPEFDFEKVHTNVEGAVKRLDVTWPVALDDDMTIWSAFKNQYWPADYVADRTGHLRYSHFGEGDYTNTENVLRTLLGVAANAPARRPGEGRDRVRSTGEPGDVSRRGRLATAEPDRCRARACTNTRPTPRRPRRRRVLEGTWNGFAEQVTAVKAGSAIAVGVHAQSVNLVLAIGHRQTRRRDHHARRATDTRRRTRREHPRRRHRQTVVTVTAPDMYRLVVAPGVEDHQLRVIAAEPGLEAYSFTFG